MNLLANKDNKYKCFVYKAVNLSTQPTLLCGRELNIISVGTHVFYLQVNLEQM